MPCFWTLYFSLLVIARICTGQAYWDQHENKWNPHNLALSKNEGRILASQPSCQVLLVESIPVNLTYPPGSPKFASTYFAWNLLIDQAKKNLSIASFYWSLVAEPQFNASSVEEGRTIFDSLVQKAKEVDLSIEQSGAKKADVELDQLSTAGATIYWVDVAKLLGQGIIHTKLWTVDRKHAYIGSANMDWRSLTQVKELGALLINCPALVEDLDKIHGSYRLASKGVPSSWPNELITRYNRTHPMQIQINGIPSRIYFSASPQNFTSPGRTDDLDAILNIIQEANKFVYISVMDYSPEIITYGQNRSGKFWPDIDDALRTAAIDRGVEVRLLISQWKYSSNLIPKYLKSLRSINGVRGARIRVRYFVVPNVTKDQESIPHARVNHNKYMVTDKTAYIGTSNWSGDYFLYTGGVGFICEQNATYHGSSDTGPQPQPIQNKLLDIFTRDWNSEHAFEEWN